VQCTTRVRSVSSDWLVDKPTASPSRRTITPSCLTSCTQSGGHPPRIRPVQLFLTPRYFGGNDACGLYQRRRRWPFFPYPGTTPTPPFVALRTDDIASKCQQIDAIHRSMALSGKRWGRPPPRLAPFAPVRPLAHPPRVGASLASPPAGPPSTPVAFAHAPRGFCRGPVALLTKVL
jgi:hypothetical protein